MTDLTERAWADPHRPRFHFVSPAAWLNDPNGLSQWNGVYHLFYQYNPDAPVHARIHWGHATSTDLVHWTEEPIALAPDTDADADGCWSGVLVDDGGVPTIVYSGHREGEGQLPCLATGDADLRTWRKDPGNPVIGARPDGVELNEFRDHCVWREDGEWRQLVGSGVKGQGGTALLYRSPDLRSWEYVGPLLVGDAAQTAPVWTGSTWECVDLFGLDGADVLVVSAWHEGVTHHPLYYTGAYAGGRFTPSAVHHLDYGLRYFYAPQSMRDESGRRIMFGWLQEGRTHQAAVDAGWSGVMSLPREVTMGPDGQLVQRPADEVAQLRRAHTGADLVVLDEGNAIPVTSGVQLDVEATVVLPRGSVAEFAVRATADGAERTRIVLDASSGEDHVEVRLDRAESSLDPTVDATPLGGTAPVGADRRVHLRVLVDHSALEIFVNGRALTARAYPSRPDADGVSVSAVHGTVEVEQIDCWEMADVWHGPRPRHP